MIITKSFRPTNEDAVRIAFIKKNDPRIEKRGNKSTSETIRLCYENALKDAYNWKIIAKKMQSKEADANIKDVSDLDVEESSITTFCVDDDVLLKILDSVREQLGLLRPRISYVTRLCIYATSLSINQSNSVFENNNKTLETNDINGIELIKQIIELLVDPSAEAQEKILSIERICKGGESYE